MNPLTSLASRLAQQLFNRNLDDVRQASSVASEGLSAVRQTPVPKVLGRARFNDGFEKNTGQVASTLVWGQTATKPTAAAVDRFCDSFQMAQRAPVNLSGEYPARVASTAPAFIASASKPGNGFSASLNDLPQLG